MSEAEAPAAEEAAPAAEAAPEPQSAEATPAESGTLLGGKEEESPASSDPKTDPWVADGKFTTAFLDQLGSDEARTIVEKYQGDPVKAMSALKEAQSLIGKRFSVPDKDTDPDVLAKFREVNRIPDSPEGYNIEPPKDLPEGVEFDEGHFLQHYAPLFHELNLTPAQSTAIIARHIEAEGMRAQQMKTSAEGQNATYIAEQKKALETAFGGQYTERVADAQRFAQTIGVDLNDPVVGNNAALIQAFAKGASLVSPDRMVPPTQVATAQSYAAQARDIQTNPDNREYALYRGTGGTYAEQQATREKVRALLNKAAQV